jgi:hypothetical protein
MRALLLSVLCCWSLSSVAQTTVESFAPVGVVKKIRQVTARFSAPMVAFGDPRAPAPFAVDCAEKGSGRWIDAHTWSYDFERDLPGAVACRFSLRADGRDLAGQPLAGQRVFGFSTGGPAVVQAQPRAGGESIDEQQVFVLGLDAPAREDSIMQNAWCRADGINEKIGVRLLAGAERERVLATRREFVDRYLQVYFRARGVNWRARLPLHARINEQLPLVVLQCQRTLPADATVKLVWGAGIAAANGIATTQDQTLDYETRPDFTARLSCDRVNAKSGCIPFLPVRLGFTAPIATADAAQVYLAAPGGKRFPAKLAEQEAKAPYVSDLTIPGPFPEQAKLTLHLPPDLKDDASRTLLNRARLPLAVRTGEQPPLVKFAAPFGIIEARGDRMLPVTVRNVEPELAASMRSAGASMRLGGEQDAEVLRWLKKLTASRPWNWTSKEPHGRELEKPVLADAKDAAVQRFELPKPNGRRAFEVIGIPLREPGFYVVELASPKLGAALNRKGRKAYVHAGALVTNMVAHFKHGAQSSLVWVTSLDKGRPVAGAKVAVRDCAGKLLWSGTTDKSGVARIEGELAVSGCRANNNYFISARSGADYTFTLSDWNEGIEAWRFNLPHGSHGQESRIAATVFDRTLLRAGETLHMKHYLRRHTEAGLALVRAADAPPKEPLDWRAREPGKLFLIHQGSGEKLELPLQWDAAGSAQGEWTIPAEARLGVYEVMMGGQVSGQFRVEQFRVPTMKAGAPRRLCTADPLFSGPGPLARVFRRQSRAGRRTL